MRLYVLYLIWNNSTLTSLKLLLMTKGAWSKVGASKNLSLLSRNAKFHVSTVRYTASSWRHIKFSKICLLFCFSTGSKYYDPNFWLLWKFILRHNSLKNYYKMILNKRKFAYFSKKWFCICKNGGVNVYATSFKYEPQIH